MSDDQRKVPSNGKHQGGIEVVGLRTEKNKYRVWCIVREIAPPFHEKSQRLRDGQGKDWIAAEYIVKFSGLPIIISSPCLHSDSISGISRTSTSPALINLELKSHSLIAHNSDCVTSHITPTYF